MASILQLTDKLLSATGHRPLAEFIPHHVSLDRDAEQIQIELFKATGEYYDRRTIKRWMQTYALKGDT